MADNEIIQLVITAYSDDDWLTHSYCDEILLQFERETVTKVYQEMIIDIDGVRRGVERFLTL